MHTKLPWSGQDESGFWLADHDWTATAQSAVCSTSAPIHSDGKVIALVVAEGLGTDEELEANAALIVKAVNNHDQLVSTLRLIQTGLRNGSVKSNPILSFSDDAASAGIQSLSSVVDAALAKVTP